MRATSGRKASCNTTHLCAIPDSRSSYGNGGPVPGSGFGPAVFEEAAHPVSENFFEGKMKSNLRQGHTRPGAWQHELMEENMCPILGLGRASLSNEAVMGPRVLKAGVPVTVGHFGNKQGVAKVTKRND
jgi:hypothetical protein